MGRAWFQRIKKFEILAVENYRGKDNTTVALLWSGVAVSHEQVVSGAVRIPSAVSKMQ